MKTLMEMAAGRDNNLNAIRLVAAFAVLVSHSFALATGDASTEPMRAWLEMTPGTMAVDVFFLVSGFLVTGSLLTGQRAGAFVVSRGLRIFPGLLFALVLTVLVLGPLVTSVPEREYFSTATAKYFVRCATVIRGVDHHLPGVFIGNPYTHSVNGSLWTLTWEVRCYLALLVVWLASAPLGVARGQVLRIAAAAAFIGLFVARAFDDGHDPMARPVLTFLGMFALGSFLWQIRSNVTLRASWLGLALAMLLATALWARQAFALVYPFALAYSVLYVAYMPARGLRKGGTHTDVSYGVYLYAFPVQQLVVHLVPGIGVVALMLASAAATTVLAVLSWRLVERPSISLKPRLMGLIAQRQVRPAAA